MCAEWTWTIIFRGNVGVGRQFLGAGKKLLSTTNRRQLDVNILIRMSIHVFSSLASQNADFCCAILSEEACRMHKNAIRIVQRGASNTRSEKMPISEQVLVIHGHLQELARNRPELN